MGNAVNTCHRGYFVAITAPEKLGKEIQEFRKIRADNVKKTAKCSCRAGSLKTSCKPAVLIPVLEGWDVKF